MVTGLRRATAQRTGSTPPGADGDRLGARRRIWYYATGSGALASRLAQPKRRLVLARSLDACHGHGCSNYGSCEYIFNSSAR